MSGSYTVHRNQMITIDGVIYPGHGEVRVYQDGTVEVLFDAPLRQPRPSLYHEIHVTIAYFEVSDPGLEDLRTWASSKGWRMGDLLLARGGGTERSRKDLFFTARAPSYDTAETLMQRFMEDLRDEGFEAIRYKIEDTVLDSKMPEGGV